MISHRIIGRKWLTTDQLRKANYELEQSTTVTASGSKNYEGRVKLEQPEHSLKISILSIGRTDADEGFIYTKTSYVENNEEMDEEEYSENVAKHKKVPSETNAKLLK